MAEMRTRCSCQTLEASTSFCPIAVSRKATTTKTETPRRNPIEPALVPLLRVMRKEAGGTGRVAPRMVAKLAPFLRRCLETAGVARPELFTSTKTQKALRFYDLRATGITWMATTRGGLLHAA